MRKLFIPYTYLVGWTKLDKWYYGSEYSEITKIANPSNIMTTYLTSSADVHSLIEQHGLPDVVEIRKTFKTADAARKWEIKVLRRLKVAQTKKWLNKTNGGAIDLHLHHWAKDPVKRRAVGQQITNSQKGRPVSAEWRDKIRKALKGRKLPAEHKQKYRDNHASKKPGYVNGMKGKIPHNKGIAMKDEQRKKLESAWQKRIGKKCYNDGSLNYFLLPTDSRVVDLKQGMLFKNKKL